RKRALIKRIDLAGLCAMKDRGWQRHVRIAAGLCQHLHFGVNPATSPTIRIRQRKVAMDKGVTRRSRAALITKASMLIGKSIAESNDLAARIRRCVRRPHTMV